MKILILDVPQFDNERVKGKLEMFGATVVSTSALNSLLVTWEGWEQLNPKTTLVVFPGNGATLVNDQLPADWHKTWRSAAVSAKRFWLPGTDPFVTVGRVYEKGFLIGFRDIVIVDDVVSSGKTAQLIKQYNMPWVPGARWHVVAWVGQLAASTSGFTSHFFALNVGERAKKVPINSLSTLLADRKIAESYGRRNIANYQLFLCLLDEMRSGWQSNLAT